MIEASQLKQSFSPKVKDTVARQLKNLQSTSQGTCNKVVEEYNPKVKDTGTEKIEELTDQRSRKL